MTSAKTDLYSLFLFFDLYDYLGDNIKRNNQINIVGQCSIMAILELIE